MVVLAHQLGCSTWNTGAAPSQGDQCTAEQVLNKDLVLEWGLPLSRAERSVLTSLRITLSPARRHTPPQLLQRMPVTGASLLLRTVCGGV